MKAPSSASSCRLQPAAPGEAFGPTVGDPLVAPGEAFGPAVGDPLATEHPPITSPRTAAAAIRPAAGRRARLHLFAIAALTVETPFHSRWPRATRGPPRQRTIHPGESRQ